MNVDPSRPRPAIYVVDDDASLRTALTRLLTTAGYDVVSCASAGEFLLVPKADRPTCVVLDIRMPGLNGLDLQEALSRMEEALPVVFLTGHGDVPMTVR